MVEQTLKKENLYSKEILKKLSIDFSGLENSGDKYKFLDKIVNSKDSKNKIKQVYEVIYNYASEFKKELIENSISVDKLIIDKIYSRKEIFAIANFWNLQTGVLFDSNNNVFITINIKMNIHIMLIKHISKIYLMNITNWQKK